MSHMLADDPAAADPARRRLLQKSHHLRFPFRHPKNSVPLPLPLLLPLPQHDHPANDILVDDPPLLTHDEDVYRWAVLYENQRGITLFSTPFYSPHSLLPSDPQPFTIPNSHASRNHLPNLSLDNYPLPDGTWRWVSTAWMIDMRSELGEVQPDGFEYNWLFRHTNWHAKIGVGAWVRRRRWVRLMMRPCHAHNNLNHTLTPSSFPPSASKHSLEHHWLGGEQDWQHVHRLLKLLGRDGRKLELWRMWLTPYTQDAKGKSKQSDPPSLSSQKVLQIRLSDVISQGSPPPLAHLITILANHGDAILRSFVFPDSRAQFIHLVSQAGLAQDLERCLGRVCSAADVDFWSYANKLDKLSHIHT